MNVLSLFDGMSCAQIALNKIGIIPEKYFASEIDKHAIKVTLANFPNTIQLGSVVDVDINQLPKIDLLCGGSPCQSFSFAGKRNGMSTKDEVEILTLNHYLQLKSEGYEFEGQSYLFWEYMRVLIELRKVNPDIKFLLENVIMGEKWERILTIAIGVNPIEINSSLVSAQNRRRLYWTNIGMEPQGLFGDLESIIQQPKDRGVLLRDILETNVDDKYFLSDKMIHYLNNRKANFNNGKINYKTGNDKSSCINKSSSSLDLSDNIIIVTKPEDVEVTCVAMRGREVDNKNVQQFEPRNDGKTNSITTVQKDNLIITNERKIIQYNIPELVSVRRHEIDKKKLIEFLQKYRSGSITKIAKFCNAPKTMVEHWFRKDDCFSIPDAEYWPKLKECLGITDNQFDSAIIEFDEKESVFEKSNRVYDENGLSPTLTSTSCNEKILVHGCDIRTDEGLRLRKNGKSGTLAARARNDESCGQLASINSRIRRLTPMECERLQTVPDNYTSHVSDTQRYRMLGNGWTIEVIKHIFSYLTLNKPKES